MIWTSSFLALSMLVVFGPHSHAQESSARESDLTNGVVTAHFGRLGLESVSDITSHAAPLHLQDGWAVQVNNDALRNTDAVPSMHTDRQKVTYSYSLKGYSVEVIYKVQAGWHFVSKTIQIAQAPRSSYTLRKITPLSAALVTDFTGTYIPSSYVPQLGNTVEQTRAKLPARDLGMFLRRQNTHDGLMLLVQNPFLQAEHTGRNVSLSYAPQMEWQQAWGPFVSDTACIGPYQLTGETMPREMLLEWHLPDTSQSTPGLDRGEVRAFMECVREFLIHPSPFPVSVEVGWTLNDYQIDVGTDEGRQDYKHIIDATSDLGIQTLLYAPTNNSIAKRDDDTDSWHWEHTLWLGLGQKIRKGEWDPAKDSIPADVQTMLDYAHAKHVGLLAYVYPSVPFQGNAAWLVTGSGTYEANLRFASMSSRSLQDKMLRDLIAFKRRSGVAGYSFDYAFLDLQGSSSYSQWWGWRRVMEELRKAEPEIVIDGRQSYQLYGPWSWLAGNYPHPTGQDEQPESFVPFPDLHFDRVSADRMRFVNFWYRNYQFAPAEVVPGYATHQTERSRNVPSDDMTGGHPQNVEEVHSAYRERDWDYLGFRYSFLSSIGTAGWNNVINMIPARDKAEREAFSQADKDWIRKWLQWTRQNREYLQHTQSILHQPQIGKLDGTSAMLDDRGYLFLFNPNYKAVTDAIQLDASIGLKKGDDFVLRELYPREGRIWGKPGAGLWHFGDSVPLDLDGTSATVLEVVPAAKTDISASVFNADTLNGAKPQVQVQGASVKVEHGAGEPGSTTELGLMLSDTQPISAVSVNGKKMPFVQHGRYLGIPASFAGTRFRQAQQVNLQRDPDGSLRGSLILPARVLEQLKRRSTAWPIPWTAEDKKTTWLAPERLLLFVQAAEPQEGMTAQATLDGKPLLFRHAYTSTRVHAPALVGLYADLSAVQSDVKHTLSLHLDGMGSSTLLGVFFDNVEPQETTEVIAVSPLTSVSR